MIMLKPISGSVSGGKVFRSALVTKPTGNGLTTFTITHNHGRTPDRIIAYAKYTGQTEYRQVVDYYWDSENRGYFINATSGENASSINVYRVDDGSGQSTSMFFQMYFDTEGGIN